MNYYISDTHFGHKNIIHYDAENGGKKFSSIEEHDNFLIENWNNIVTPQDNVYIIGDFSWLNPQNTEELIKKLNGQKYLIKGNHDYWVKNGNCRKLFKGIYEYKIIQDEDKTIVMSHYPIMFYQNQHRGSILLYGHVHNTKEEKLFQDACKHIANTEDIPMNCYNVGCMLWDYKPVTLQQIMENKKINKKKEQEWKK